MVFGSSYRCPNCGKQCFGCVLDRPCFECSTCSICGNRLKSKIINELMEIKEDYICPRCKKQKEYEEMMKKHFPKEPDLEITDATDELVAKALKENEKD